MYLRTWLLLDLSTGGGAVGIGPVASLWTGAKCKGLRGKQGSLQESNQRSGLDSLLARGKPSSTKS